jgi:hypothetical protein
MSGASEKPLSLWERLGEGALARSKTPFSALTPALSQGERGAEGPGFKGDHYLDLPAKMVDVPQSQNYNLSDLSIGFGCLFH